jgi:pimeloyl-ACP methyl ester carboxylesterase
MEKQIQIQNLRVNYNESGTGDQTVVLLHGWGCDSTIFRALQAHLESKFKVLALDFPGFGRSQEPNEPWGTAEYTTLTKDWLTALGVTNPIVIGHSFGGRIILRLSKEISFRKIIITGGAGLRNQVDAKKNVSMKSRMFKLMKGVVNILPVSTTKKEQLIDSGIRKYKFGSADYQAASPMMRKVLVKVVNEDLRDFLPFVKASTLLIYGENDTATPVALAKIMEKEIKDAGLVVLKNAGHFAFLEQQVQFLAITDSFLN